MRRPCVATVGREPGRVGVTDSRPEAGLIGEPEEEGAKLAQDRLAARGGKRRPRLGPLSLERTLEGDGLLGVEPPEIGATDEGDPAVDRGGGFVDRGLRKPFRLGEPEQVAALDPEVIRCGAWHGRGPP